MRNFRFLKIALTFLGLCIMNAQGQSFTSLWKQLNEAERKDLPQTVIQIAGRIEVKALQEKQVGQLFKAMLWREYYQQQLTPDSLFSALQRMEQWSRTEEEMVSSALLHSILATHYANYLRAEGYHISQRTELLPEEASDDPRTWTRGVFVAVIDRHLTASLSNPQQLMKVKTTAYQPLIKLQQGSEGYGHDLYHLLARRAIDLYSSLSMGMRTDAEEELQSKVDSIYTAMRDWYNKVGRHEACLLVDLEQLRHQRGEGLQALDSLITVYGDLPLCTELYIEMARRWMNRGESGCTQALGVCDEGLKRYPNYARVNALRNLKAMLLQPALSVSLARSYYPGDSLRLALRHRLLSSYRVRIYEAKVKEYPLESAEDVVWLKSIRGAQVWSTTHSLLADRCEGVDAEVQVYLTKRSEQAFPLSLSEGLYVVEVMPLGAAQSSEGCYFLLPVTRLHPVLMTLPDGTGELRVVDWKSGRPMEGANVCCYTRIEGRADSLRLKTMSDAAGRCTLGKVTSREYIRISKGKDVALPPFHLWQWGPYRHTAERRETMRLLTDRAIYRPGQTVQLKGIYYSQQEECLSTIQGKQVEVILLDANRKEIARQTAVTNPFGSFTASFVLPSTCLNGRFALKSSLGGEASIRVEEYKQPSFEVTIAHPSLPYRWGDSLTLQGNVMGYQGAPVQGAAVAYTLKGVLPTYRWRSEERSFRQDTVYTDAEGRFLLPLFLDKRPDTAGVQIEATVVAADGEVQQTSYYLPVAESSIRFLSSLPEVMCKEDSLCLTLGVENLSGERLEATGRYWLYAHYDEMPDYSHPVAEGKLRMNQRNEMSGWHSLPSGRYRCVVEAAVAGPRTGRDTLSSFVLFSRSDRKLPKGVNRFVYEESLTFDEKHPAVIYYGVSGQPIYLYRDMMTDQQCFSQEVVQLTDTLMRLEIPYQQRYGKGIQLALGYVKEGEWHHSVHQLTRLDKPKALQIRWNVMRDRLNPGQQEEWQLQVTQEDEGAEAELMALLYDASLDRFVRHNPTFTTMPPRPIYYPYQWRSMSRPLPYRSFNFPWKELKVPAMAYDEMAWPQSLVYRTKDRLLLAAKGHTASRALALAPNSALTTVEDAAEMAVAEESDGQTLDEEEISSLGDEKPVQLRERLDETAFFYPQLATDAEGHVTLRFVAPQRLTRWNFIGFAHTQQMLTGTLRTSVVTAKEFMLQPQWPRFVRAGDEMELSATITNQTANKQQGSVKLTLFDPATEKVLQVKRISFAVGAMASQVVRFQLKLSDDRSVVGVRMVADGGTFSDGEQLVLPILSRKVPVTETIPLVINGKGSYTYALDTLFNNHSPKATQRRLTLEMTGNPAWYAVSALPAMLPQGEDNAISWAASWYAHALGQHLVKQHPVIQYTLEAWRAQGVEQQALSSRLEQNQEVKEILLHESPWVMEAESETERQRRMARFFDENQMRYRLTMALEKLRQLQLPSGAWSWFAGMDGNSYVTHFILQQLFRLPMLTGEPLPMEARDMARKGMNFLHQEAMKRYEVRHRKQGDSKQMVAMPQDLEYLYLLTICGENPEAKQKKVVDECLRLWEEARASTSLAQKARLAVVLLAHGRGASAAEVVQSIKEHITLTPGRGASFAMKETDMWGMGNISLHVACMEALQRAGGEEPLIGQMKVWLLQQKQTRSWGQAVASADAVYALLMQGSSEWLTGGRVLLTLGKEQIDTTADEALEGMASIQRTFTEGDAALRSRKLQVEKQDEGMAWGAVYARCLLPLEEVKSYGQGLQVEKQLFVERVDAGGKSCLERLIEGTTPLTVGDRVVSRLVIRTDRSMEFVQLKDQRGACFEPLSVLSGYRWSRGMGYYLDVKDASASFFFDCLPKGVHVLEHSYRVVRAGTYEAGMASMQCAYAPEFAAHSAAIRVIVTR